MPHCRAQPQVTHCRTVNTSVSSTVFKPWGRYTAELKPMAASYRYQPVMPTGNCEVGVAAVVGVADGERDNAAVGMRDGDTVGDTDTDEIPVTVTATLHVDVEKHPTLKIRVGALVARPGTVYVKMELPPAVPQESSSNASCLPLVSTSRI